MGDKLEFDSAGAVNTEITSTVANGCSLTVKTELNELKNVLKSFKEVGGTAVGVTYTGIADTTVKVETKLADPTCLGSYELDKDTQLATSCALRGSESGAVS